MSQRSFGRHSNGKPFGSRAHFESKRKPNRGRFCALKLCALEDRTTPAILGPAELLKDINLISGTSSNPTGFIQFADHLYFSADDGIHGTELWRTDGTALGTVQVADINPGPGSGVDFSSRAVVGNALFFVGDDGLSGKELWRFTGSKVERVADIVPGLGTSSPVWLTAGNGVLYFRATTPDKGAELWKSDGTATGTTMVGETMPGSDSGYPSSLTYANGSLFFAANHPQSTFSSFWKTDGNTLTLLSDPSATGGLISAIYMAPYGNGVMFAGCADPQGYRYRLWVSDGTPAGTVQVPGAATAFERPQFLTPFNGKMYFVGWSDAISGTGLWRSDGNSVERITSLGNGIVYYNTGDLCVVDDNLYFPAVTANEGRELWRYDGMATHLVSDINPGKADSSPTSFLSAEGQLIFQAVDATGTELWVANESGASPWTEIAPSTPSSYPTAFTRLDDKIVFRATNGTMAQEPFVMPIRPRPDTVPQFAADVNDTTGGGVSEVVVLNGIGYYSKYQPQTGRELYQTDGFVERLVADIVPGSSSSYPGSLTVVNNRLYFTATTPETGTELWTLENGVPTLVADIYTKTQYGSIASSSPSNLTAAGGKLFFFATNELGFGLWTITDSGPLRLSQVYQWANEICAVGGTVYFISSTPSSDYGLAKSDGTIGGTVTFVHYGYTSQLPANMFAIGSTVYFRYYQPGYSYQLWKTNGTSAGTARVTWITPSFSFGRGVTIDNSGVFYFYAGNAVGDAELWRSNGTDTGTYRVIDINPGTAAGVTGDLVPLNGLLYFAANDGIAGTELWRSDGTASGTIRLSDINPGPASSGLYDLTSINNSLHFLAFDPEHGSEYWTFDQKGIRRISDINPGEAYSSPLDFVGFNDRIVFRANDVSSTGDLWASDGTEVVRVSPGGLGPTPSSSPTLMFDAAGTLFFTASDNAGTVRLYRYDQLTDASIVISPADLTLDTASTSFAAVGSAFYFTAKSTGSSLWRLWKSDGTVAGTQLVMPSTSTLRAFQLIAYDGRLFFSGGESGDGTELWVTDGSALGTVRVKDINPGIGSSSPTSFVVGKGFLYFVANDGITGSELWRTDGTTTGTVLVADVYPGPSSSAPINLTTVGANLYFVAIEPGRGNELWRTDATLNGAVLVADISPGSAGTYFANLTNVNGRLYFSADDHIFGEEVWRTDGTPETTIRLTDLAPGSKSASPSRFSAGPKGVYFTAKDGGATERFYMMAPDTSEVSIVAGPGGGVPSSTIASFRDELFFVGSSSNHGSEIWTVDLNGTLHELADLNPGTTGTSSSSTPLVESGGRLYFRGFDSFWGHELWDLEPDPFVLPKLKNVSTTLPLITDFAAGPQVMAITLQYDRVMDVSTTPTITFPNERPGNSLVFTVGSWIGTTVYQARFDVFDTNIQFDGIDVQVSNARSLNGLRQNPTTVADLFSIDTAGPQVLHIERSTVNATTADSAVYWNILFSKPVTGVNANHFSLVHSGLQGSPTITQVSGIGQYWAVLATTGIGLGTIGLNFVAADGIRDNSGNVYDGPLPVIGKTYNVDRPPAVVAALINDGAQQRSRVASMTINFDRAISFAMSPAAIFAIDGPQGSVGRQFDFSGSSPTRTIVRITFTGPQSSAGSLLDGNYALTINPDGIVDSLGRKLDGNVDGLAGDGYSLNFHRLFGDFDGDRRVAANDFAQFRQAYYSFAPAYLAAFDADQNGVVDASDYTEFRLRYGTMI